MRGGGRRSGDATSWWKDALIGALPWIVVPIAVAAALAWSVADQPGAAARTDALAGIAGVFVGGGTVLAFARAYLRSRERGGIPPRNRNAAVASACVGLVVALGMPMAARYQDARTHYGPEASAWSNFLAGCTRECRDGELDATTCARYCDCSTASFFAATTKQEAKGFFAALAAGRSASPRMQERLDGIQRRCVTAVQTAVGL